MKIRQSVVCVLLNYMRVLVGGRGEGRDMLLLKASPEVYNSDVCICVDMLHELAE